jgi:hypothetical protein
MTGGDARHCHKTHHTQSHFFQPTHRPSLCTLVLEWVVGQAELFGKGVGYRGQCTNHGSWLWHILVVSTIQNNKLVKNMQKIRCPHATNKQSGIFKYPTPHPKSPARPHPWHWLVGVFGALVLLIRFSFVAYLDKVTLFADCCRWFVAPLVVKNRKLYQNECPWCGT